MLSRSEAGFSLLELVLVLVVASVLTAAATARWDRSSGLDELGFTERTLTALRLAQRRALADRCDVRVRITPAGLEVAQRATLCGGAFSLPVAGTAGAGSTLDSAPQAGLVLSASPATFYFDATGGVRSTPGGAVTDVTISVGERDIDVIGATGHASL